MKRLYALLMVVGLLSGCTNLGPGNDDPNNNNGRPNDTAPVPGLRAFTSESDLNDYLSGQVQTRAESISTGDALPGIPPAFDGDDLAADGAGGGAQPAPAADLAVNESGSGHSGTTLQEVGVDEADVVKTDGTYLYVASGETFKIVQASPLSVVSEMSLGGWARNMYLHGDKIVTLTETYGYWEGDWGGIPVDFPAPTDDIDADIEPAVDVSGGGSDGSMGMVDGDMGMMDDVQVALPPVDGLSFAPVFSRPRTTVAIYNVADRAAPALEAKYDFDGYQASSRMIDGVLRLVVANYQAYYFDVMPMMGRPGASTTEVDPTLIIPKYNYTDGKGVERSGDMCTFAELYRPEDADGFGTMTLVSLDVDKSDTFNAIGLVAEPGLIYSSTDALYVTNTEYDYTGTLRSSTNIYKFTYTADNAVPTATGSIPGRVLNQYSMGEHNGNLRVATTVDPIWSPEGIIERATNSVYVLGESSGALTTLGKIENIAEGETIQAARFMGDRGYLVTFESVDPLFTLDLADPVSPKIVGELKVPGYSTYLVPMDQNHLLAVGQYIPGDGETEIFWRPWGVQLTIFDITDFANPVQQHNVIIGEDDGAYSEALWDPKAFNYYAEESLVALPISIYDNPWGDIDIEGAAIDGDISDDEAEQLADEIADVIVDVIDDTVSSGGDDVGFATDPWVPQGFDGLIVYSVSPESGIVEKGRISTRFDEKQWYYPSFTRGVFIGDSVYAVTDGGVRSASVAAPATVTAEVFYGPEPVIWDDVVDPVDGWVDGDDVVVESSIDPETGESTPVR